MAKYSEKMMGKEVGSASVYAKPHTMTGKEVGTKVPEKSGKAYMDEMNISSGSVSRGNYPAEKTTGIKMRGVGAATKGTTCRGPMG